MPRSKPKKSLIANDNWINIMYCISKEVFSQHHSIHFLIEFWSFIQDCQKYQGNTFLPRFFQRNRIRWLISDYNRYCTVSQWGKMFFFVHILQKMCMKEVGSKNKFWSYFRPKGFHTNKVTCDLRNSCNYKNIFAVDGFFCQKIGLFQNYGLKFSPK